MNDKMLLQCSNVVHVVDNMKKIVFKVLGDFKFDFSPGQHLEISYPDMNGDIQLRHYSLTNICQESKTVSISVKKGNNNGVSSSIFNNLRSGGLVTFEGVGGIPFGAVEKKKLFIFCSGIGVTPVIALLNHIEKDKSR